MRCLIKDIALCSAVLQVRRKIGNQVMAYINSCTDSRLHRSSRSARDGHLTLSLREMLMVISRAPMSAPSFYPTERFAEAKMRWLMLTILRASSDSLLMEPWDAIWELPTAIS